jgi:hypothetical protein
LPFRERPVVPGAAIGEHAGVRVRSIPATLLLAATVLASGCAGLPAAPPPPEVDARWLHDERFGPPSEAVSTASVFAVDGAMRQYLARDIGPLVRRIGPKAALVEALFTRDALKIEYQGAATRTAADAFAARAGNCLSLVVLTAALAQELGLPVRFQSALIDDVWSREGDLLFESGHVNITLDEHPANHRQTLVPTPTTIDFLPPADIARMRLRAIGVERIEAMFANNRAVEALVRGGVDDAYAWARHAVRRDPSFASAWNTLGVVYLRRGLLETAAALFEAVAAAGDAPPTRPRLRREASGRRCPCSSRRSPRDRGRCRTSPRRSSGRAGAPKRDRPATGWRRSIAIRRSTSSSSDKQQRVLVIGWSSRSLRAGGPPLRNVARIPFLAWRRRLEGRRCRGRRAMRCRSPRRPARTRQRGRDTPASSRRCDAPWTGS